jgi:hypothetical protein
MLVPHREKQSSAPGNLCGSIVVKRLESTKGSFISQYAGFIVYYYTTEPFKDQY